MVRLPVRLQELFVGSKISHVDKNPLLPSPPTTSTSPLLRVTAFAPADPTGNGAIIVHLFIFGLYISAEAIEALATVPAKPPATSTLPLFKVATAENDLF